MNSREIERQRREIYRATRARRIRNFAELVRWIRAVGMAWVFAPARGPELPSLMEAVSGKRGVHIEDWNADSDLVWAWKNDIAAARRAYYGKVLGKPAVISLALLPHLFAVHGQESFHELYARGGLSLEAKKVYTALERTGPQPTISLRRAAGLDSHEGRSRYLRALEELERHMLVLPIGATIESGPWASQIIDLFARWYPETLAAAREIDERAARRTLVEKYVRTVAAASSPDIGRVLRLTRSNVDETLCDLLEARRIVQEGSWILPKPNK